MTNTETREAPPPLALRPPLCPMCGEETVPEEGCFICLACDCSWHADGSFMVWTDFEDQCPVTVRPWEDNPQIPDGVAFKHDEFRCLLGDGHGRRGFLLHAHPMVNGQQWVKGEWR